MNVKSKRRTETLIEAHEVWVIRRARKSSQEWCGQCPNQSLMLTPEEAARLMKVTARTIYRWVETGRVHFQEMDAGSLLICLASLPAADVDSELKIRETPVTD